MQAGTNPNDQSSTPLKKNIIIYSVIGAAIVIMIIAIFVTISKVRKHRQQEHVRLEKALKKLFNEFDKISIDQLSLETDLSPSELYACLDQYMGKLTIQYTVAGKNVYSYDERTVVRILNGVEKILVHYRTTSTDEDAFDHLLNAKKELELAKDIARKLGYQEYLMKCDKFSREIDDLVTKFSVDFR